jgi:hypothetical protein
LLLCVLATFPGFGIEIQIVTGHFQ